MTARLIRVGGVPEHFNLPWLLAIERAVFDDLGVVVEWHEFAAGTGAIMDALRDGDIDMATPLTEGAITAIATGAPCRVVRLWVESPLLWGIHVAADSPILEIGEAEGSRFAISRFGSGSELMSRVLAEDQNWTLDESSWVPVETIDGAVLALTRAQAEMFLWNKSMTQPYVDDGSLRRIGVMPTPWPSFAVVATTALLDDDPVLVARIADTALLVAADFAADPSSSSVVAERFGLEPDDASKWLEHVRWTAPGTPVPLEVLAEVAERMRRIGRLTEIVDPANLVAGVPS